jgi:TRAP-type C4-dicarboxylate transport system substrate-binding protein
MFRAAVIALGVALTAAAPSAAQTYPETRLRVVGGLANVPQYLRHEEPFWTRRLPDITRGAVRAEIAPFDRSGIRAQELFQLLRLGVAPFVTVALANIAGEDPEFAAPDLAGLNPDMPSLRRNLAAYRVYLETTMRARYGIEVLAIYVYPAQVVFCNRPFQSLADLRGRRVRVSGVAQSDFVEAFGALPVIVPFAQMVESVRGGVADCAITGTMSGNVVGLHEVTSHVGAAAISWGMNVFAAHGEAWRALAEPVRALLRRELRALEAEIWDSSERETREGLDCNAGAAACASGRRGRMTVVPVPAAESARIAETFRAHVLPRWIHRCGGDCVDAWNASLAPATGVAAELAR